MKRINLSIAGALALMLFAAGCSTQNNIQEKTAIAIPKEDVKLVLPEKIYAVPGVETNVYFENIVRVLNPDNYVFEASAPYGRCDEKRWRYTPGAKDPRSFKLTIRVIGNQGELAKKDVTVEVSPVDAGKGRAISAMIVGDSLTDATHYVRRINGHFLRANINPSLKLVGSHAGAGRLAAKDGIVHEGYGGWTWNTFQRRWTSKEKLAKLRLRREIYRARSPFLKQQKDGKLVLDFKGYFERNNNGKAPDFITFLLGVNDVFSATDDNIETRVNTILANMDKLLFELRKAAPDAVIGVGLPTAGALSQDAFGKSYRSRYFRWQYKKNQHRLVEAMIEKFAKANPYKVELVPVYLNLDCENNFPVFNDNVNSGNRKRIMRQNNGVHPSRDGYYQIGDTFYCWMKNVLARPVKKTNNVKIVISK